MRLAVDANTVISGLFYRGNERQLLLSSLQGSVRLIFPEDVVDEVYGVIARTFRGHPGLLPALKLLESVFTAGELVGRRDYVQEVGRWSLRLRDPSDAPLLACASAVKADGVVSGNRDVLELREIEGLRTYRTREILRRLAAL